MKYLIPFPALHTFTEGELRKIGNKINKSGTADIRIVNKLQIRKTNRGKVYVEEHWRKGGEKVYWKRRSETGESVH
jgi:hypothetical protein